MTAQRSLIVLDPVNPENLKFSVVTSGTWTNTLGTELQDDVVNSRFQPVQQMKDSLQIRKGKGELQGRDGRVWRVVEPRDCMKSGHYSIEMKTNMGLGALRQSTQKRKLCGVWPDFHTDRVCGANPSEGEPESWHFFK